MAQTRSGEDVPRLVAAHAPAVILLDIGLPGVDGIEVCRRLRARGEWTPIIFLTARDDEVDRVLGLELGADDYVTKPFSPRELLARIAALVRRSAHPAAPPVDPAATAEPTLPASHPEEGGRGPDLVRLAPLTLDRSARIAAVAGRELDLTAREFDLLAFLTSHPGRVYTRPQLLRAVWGADDIAGPRTVDVHVAQVRAKLGEAADLLRTVRGVGYAARRPPWRV